MTSKSRQFGEEVHAADWRVEYLERYYWNGGRRRHPAEEWLELVRSYVSEGARVLEIGGGEVKFTARNLRGVAREIVGLDVDDLIRTNEFLDRSVVYDGRAFPLPDEYFDLVVSRWVNEHLVDPASHFAEVYRILRPGGVYLFRTVNLFGYKALVARVTPHSVQVPLVKWLAHRSDDEHDAYITYYRANTRRRINKLCRATGLEPMMLRLTESFPAYGMAARPLFFAMMAFERLVNSTPLLEGVRHTLDCVARKPVRAL